MEKIKLRILCIVTIIFVIFCIVFFLYSTHNINDSLMGKLELNNMSLTTRAVIVKMYEDSIGIMETDDVNMVYIINVKKDEMAKYKLGQELLVYHNLKFEGKGVSIITDVGKIEILKEKSDIEPSEEAIRAFYNSCENVSISIKELTASRILFTITDTNEVPYENYSKNYRIYDKTNNKILPVLEIGASEYLFGKYERTGNTFTFVFDWSMTYGSLKERLL